jgi:hypothetical protein
VMYGRGKSDSPIVPGKPPNKVGAPAAGCSQKYRLSWQRMTRTLTVGCLRHGSATPIPSRALPSLPKAGAGCGNAARPDL